MTPAIRISIGIVAVTISLLFATDWVLGIFPDPYAPALKERQELSESLAIQYSSLVTADRLSDMRLAMESVVDQMPDVLSMNLERANGDSVAVTREHSNLWETPKNGQSSPTHVLIPIFEGLGLLSTPLYKLVAVMAAAGFFAYLLYLTRTLRYLDPSSVVPSRVKAALDQLVEGVFILDHKQQIVLVNSSFAGQVGLSPDALMGVDPSGLPWLKGDGNQQSQEFPWELALQNGERVTDQKLQLQSPEQGIRLFTTNVSPIIDGGGKQRGALASFNDVSELQRANSGLKDTLNNLEKAHNEVRKKNEELFQLATIDTLTECLNRRAFFEKLELEFELAKRDDLRLSVVMADIDHFKSINDDFGHSTGDVVIKEMARTLSESAGANDCVGRYGGEEFCMLLVGANDAQARAVSNRARLAFESLFGAENSVTKGRVVTASFGFAEISYGANNVTEILNQADLALYQSKSNNRNCVTDWKDIDANRSKAS